MRWDRGTPPVGSHLPHNLRLCKGPSSDTVTHLMFLQLHICWFTGFRALLWCFHPDIPVFEVEKQVWSLKRELLGASDSGIWWWRRRIWWRQWWQLTMIFQKKTIKSLQLGQRDKTFQSLTFGWLGWDYRQRLQRLTFATNFNQSLNNITFKFFFWWFLHVPIPIQPFWRDI